MVAQSLHMSATQPGPALWPLHRSLKLFICYRRDSTQPLVNWMHEKLSTRINPPGVFLDTVSIPVATDYRVLVMDWLHNQADAVLVIIGAGWVDLRGVRQPDTRKIDQPDDPVRLEIVEAHRAGKMVVPVLVDQAQMPTAEMLPDDLRFLAPLNARRIRSTRPHFGTDLDQLYQEIETEIGERANKRNRLNPTGFEKPVLQVLPTAYIAPVGSPKNDVNADQNLEQNADHAHLTHAARTTVIKPRAGQPGRLSYDPIFSLIRAGKVMIKNEITTFKTEVEPVYFAAHLVTNADFEDFTADALGYRDQRWYSFSKYAADWHKAYPDATSLAIHADPLHPRTLINWYEAMAFARWYSVVNGRPVTLPNEAQMQRLLEVTLAAAPRRIDQANTREALINAITPIDRYPAIADIYDPFGNVQVWCLTLAQHPGQIHLRSLESRAIRGGAYCLPRARITETTSIADPVTRFAHVGLRLVLAQHS